MSSRKRHLLAFFITCLLALPLLGLIADLRPDVPASASRQTVPIRLSELAPQKTPTPVQPQQKKTAENTPPKPVTRPTSKPAPKHTQSVQNPKPVKKPAPKKHTPKPVRKPAPRKPVTHPKPVKPTPAKKAVRAVKPARPVTAKSAPNPKPALKPDNQPPANTATKPPAKSMPPASASAPAQPASPPAPPAWLGDRQRYLNQLRQRIAQLAQDTYPYRARRLGIQGTVTLHFVLQPDGRIEQLQVLHSSGQTVLDEAAQAIIDEEMGRRFKPFPPALPRHPIEVSIPIRYRLR